MPSSMDQVLGLLELARVARAVDDTTEEWIEEQIRLREEARKARDFAAADAIRDALADKGVVLEDSRRWNPVEGGEIGRVSLAVPPCRIGFPDS